MQEWRFKKTKRNPSSQEEIKEDLDFSAKQNKERTVKIWNFIGPELCE